MNLESWLKYLESLPSGLANNSLLRVRSVAEKLNLTHFPAKIITIGGTNGKGSCVAFLESILLAANYKTCAYISPHILRFNERIRINGKNVDDETLVQAFAKIEAVRGDVILSYFEFATLAAFLIFKNKNPDVLILEIGLGGRFDAVNILDSDIAIITTISLDHTQVLGNTREAIGYEKAGIMRKNKPIIFGGPDVPTSICDESKKNGANLYCGGEDFFYTQGKDDWVWQFGGEKIENLPRTKLPRANAATSLMAIKLLQKDLKICNRAIKAGLQTAYLPGRLHRMWFCGKEIIFDVAHNPESAALLAKNLQEDISKNSIAVMSMLADKDIESTLRPLNKVFCKWYVARLLGARAASVEMLCKCLREVGVKGICVAENVCIALQQAIAECTENDRIVVFGSFHTVSEGLKNFNVEDI